MCNQYVIEGVGSFSQLEWRSAIEVAADKNPGIAGILKGRWAWRSWHDEGKGPSLTCETMDWDGRQSTGASFDGKKLDCRQGAAAEVILVEGDFPKIVFRTHHALMDGNATLFWIKEVFRALRGEPLLGSRSDVNEMHFLAENKGSKQQAFTGPWSPVFEPDEKNYLRFNDIGKRSEQCIWQNVLFSEAPQKTLPKAINFLNQYIVSRSGGKVIFRVPSDLRRMLPHDARYVLSNCVAALDFELAPEDDEKRIYKKILRGLHKKQDLNIFPKRYAWGRFLTDRLFQPNEKHFLDLYQNKQCDISAIVTHVGKVSLADISCEGFLATNIYAIPVPLLGVSLSCVFLEHDKGLSLCMSAPRAYANHEQLTSLTEAMKIHFHKQDTRA